MNKATLIQSKLLEMVISCIEAVSFHYLGHENNYNNIRILTYNYVKQNPTFVYEYCVEENNIFYIDIDVNGKKVKYFIEDYIDSIKNGGFLEDLLNCIYYQKYIMCLFYYW